MEVNQLAIFLDGEPITGSFDVPEISESSIVTEKITSGSFQVVPKEYSLEMEYYMKRGKKYFMRTKEGQKISFELEELPPEITHLKYGEIITCKFTTE